MFWKRVSFDLILTVVLGFDFSGGSEIYETCFAVDCFLCLFGLVLHYIIYYIGLCLSKFMFEVINYLIQHVCFLVLGFRTFLDTVTFYVKFGGKCGGLKRDHRGLPSQGIQKDMRGRSEQGRDKTKRRSRWVGVF